MALVGCFPGSALEWAEEWAHERRLRVCSFRSEASGPRGDSAATTADVQESVSVTEIKKTKK